MIDARTAQIRRPQAGECGGIIAWLLISFVVVGALLVLGGIFLAHNIRVRESSAANDVSVETPFGSIHVSGSHGGQPQTVGMAVYPGATALKNQGSAVVDLSAGDNDLHIVAGKWETTDPIDKVQKYYEDKFPDMNVIQHTGKVEMHSIDGKGKRVIVLEDRGSTTQISLASVGEPKAN